ncbi:MAG: protein-export chaperone SecB [Flavobacterium sp.]
MSKSASFQLISYMFTKVAIDFETQQTKKVDVNFEPYGVFNQETSEYELKLDFTVIDTENNNYQFIKVTCVGTFKIEGVTTKDEIPTFFFTNSIAIVFPYLRAFISTITLQANIPVLVLPTYNLSELEPVLIANTIVK